MEASLIIFQLQAFQDTESIEKEIKYLHYPCRFKISLFRHLPNAPLDANFEICLQSERMLFTHNINIGKYSV